MIRRHPLIGNAGSKYGLVYTDNNAVFLERQTANGAITDSKKLKINIKELRGKSLVWNQLIKEGYEISFDIDNTSGTSKKYAPLRAGKLLLNSCVEGHHYYIKLKVDYDTDSDDYSGSYYFSMLQIQDWYINANTPKIITSPVSRTIPDAQANLGILGVPVGSRIKGVATLNIIDLTFLGIDNLTTVEEVEAWLANNIGDFPYYAYNLGTILNSKYNIFESVEVNQYEGELEFGNIDFNGNPVGTLAQYIRTNSFAEVLPNTMYFFNFYGTPLRNDYQVYAIWYDVHKKMISNGRVRLNNRSNTSYAPGLSPNGARYVKAFVFSATAFTQVELTNIKLCLSIYNPIHNGQYKPYKSHTINLNLTTITGKVNGEGESVIICPNGLMSADTVYDEGVIENSYLTKIIKRIDIVDLGTLSWNTSAPERHIFRCDLSEIPNIKPAQNGYSLANAICSRYTQLAYNPISANDNMCFAISPAYPSKMPFINQAYNDVPTFKAAMDGVLLIYELAEPIVYILDNPIYVGTFGHSYGVERILPQNTEEPYTTPANMVIDYSAKN